MATINNAALTSVYNFYQADLVPRSSSGSPTAHKKKDLQDIYRSIVKLSKDEPVFLMDRSTELERYTIHMKESALRFREELTSIGGTEDERIFHRTAAFSSDPGVAEVTGYPEKSGDAEQPEALELEVKQLATPQENHGKFLPEDERDLPVGNYSFDVSTQNSNYELQFTISEGDRNGDIQKRLARLINNFKLGMSAEVEEDGAGNSALVIRSKGVGSRNGSGTHFSISDENTSQTSGIVDYLGIRKVTTPAEDAVYSVNGDYFTSPNNDVHLKEGFDLKLKSAAPGNPVMIAYKADVESMRDDIVSLAGSYNSFLRAASEYLDQQPRTSLLVNQMKSTSAYYTGGLAHMGLSQAEDGTISVDEEKLSESLRTEDTQEEMGMLKDFTKFALRKANELQLNPMDYVDKRIVAYKNPQEAHYANPYVTSAYSGMLFNGYM
ncbi:MAG: flagellar filament capping protein FliD [Lachnospiraceae bacterium]|nr:flagellar filament capping protein FliD [Lachnospiraceae bacterium]